MEHILIVDDSLDNRNLLKVILKKQGYALMEAENGEEALQTARESQPDLILLDIVMPGKDGYTICTELQADTKTRDVPIIFLSAKNETKDKIRGLELGASDYITKPFNKAEVVARVRNQLQIHGLTRSLARVNRELLLKQKKIEADLEAAAQIQQSLIPQTDPEIPNFHYAHLFSPADVSGGDIFNLFALDENTWGMYMADVSGHGVPAAMVTVAVAQSMQPHGRTMLKNQEPKPPYYSLTSPGDVLTRLDELYPIERFDKYFTMAYVLFNIKTGELQYSNGGHPFPVIVRESGEIVLLEKGGTIIGMGGILPFEQGSERLHPGDRLYIYTDGITEYGNAAGDLFGAERLYESLRRERHNSLARSCRGIETDLQSFGGECKPNDDITLVALEFTPPDKKTS